MNQFQYRILQHVGAYLTGKYFIILPFMLLTTCTNDVEEQWIRDDRWIVSRWSAVPACGLFSTTVDTLRNSILDELLNMNNTNGSSAPVELHLVSNGTFSIDNKAISASKGTWRIQQDRTLIMQNATSSVEWQIKQANQDSISLFLNSHYQHVYQVCLTLKRETGH